MTMADEALGGEGSNNSNPQGADPTSAMNDPRGNDPRVLGGNFGRDFLGQKEQEMLDLFKEICITASVADVYLLRDNAALVSDVREHAETVVKLAVDGSLHSMTILVSEECKDSVAVMQQARVGLDPRVEVMETVNAELHILTQVLLATAPSATATLFGKMVVQEVRKVCSSSNNACDEVLDYLMQNGIDVHDAEVLLCDLPEEDLGLFSSRGSGFI